MGRVLDRPAFVAWLDKFLPPLYSPAFKSLTQPLDSTLITKPERLAARSHTIGLAFMRAETMNRVAASLPAGDPRAAALRRLAAMHAGQGTTAMHAAGYVGSHFLGAFSILYLLSVALKEIQQEEGRRRSNRSGEERRSECSPTFRWCVNRALARAARGAAHAPRWMARQAAALHRLRRCSGCRRQRDRADLLDSRPRASRLSIR